ncbi:MAG: glycosyltransferase family 4 protein [Pyrinomonadaceae bacterium]
MPIHVLQLGPYPPPEGGVSRNMLAIREELIKRGDECTIIATSRSASIGNEPNVYHPSGPIEVVKILSSIRFDVLHLHVGGELNNRVLGLVLIASIFGGKKSVLTVHSGAFPLTAEAKNATKGSKHGILFRRFGAMIAVNDALADVFRRFGVLNDRIHKILPFALRKPDESVNIPAHLADFCSDHSPLMLSVGGLEKDYDPFFQIRAMSKVLADHPNAGLILIGDGSMRVEVEKAIAASSYADRILVAGNVEHTVTLNLIDRADILLRTTLFDGDAISVREALFLGTPVIATQNGMRPEGTYLIEIGDEETFVRLVREISSRTKAKGIPGADEVDNISQVLDLYERLLTT